MSELMTHLILKGICDDRDTGGAPCAVWARSLSGGERDAVILESPFEIGLRCSDAGMKGALCSS